MDPIMAEKDDAGHEVHSIRGMESVISTVSGYHGTERFKLIKLIAQTGANYVGSMDRFTTHLVCWRFDGKKFDLAKHLGTHIISHRWFEDCLKKGKRLPEGPYTMLSGQETGPISWELPAVLDTRGKEKSLLEMERIVLSDLSNVNCNEVDGSASCIDLPCSNGSNSPPLNETKASKKVGRSKRLLMLEQISESIRHPKPHANFPANLPGNSSSLLPISSKSVKRKFCDLSGTVVSCEPASRSHHLAKKSMHNNSSDFDTRDSQLTESHSTLKDEIPEFVDLENLSSMIVPSTQELMSESASVVFEESSIATSTPNEDTEERNNVHIAIESNSSRNRAISGSRASQNEHCECTQEKIDLCVEGDSQNEERNKSDELGEAALLDSETGLSCVICWTCFSSTRGVLPCGHRFCFPCIQGWVDSLASKGRISTCPLCKISFSHITKFEVTSSDDQKIYSQTIPCNSSSRDIYQHSTSRIDYHDTWPSGSVCYQCNNRDPEDLLVCCHICQERWVHSCCLDPPLIPWTCVCCSDLRLLYQRFH